MNSLLDIRTTLITKAIEIINQYNTDNSSNVGFTSDNDKAFDPSPYEQYVAFFYIPAANEQVGKKGSPDEDEGIAQISVYVESQSGKYDLDQLKIVDAVRSGFRDAELNGISISDINVNGGRSEESWFVRDISVNWYKLS